MCFVINVTNAIDYIVLHNMNMIYANYTLGQCNIINQSINQFFVWSIKKWYVILRIFGAVLGLTAKLLGLMVFYLQTFPLWRKFFSCCYHWFFMYDDSTKRNSHAILMASTSLECFHFFWNICIYIRTAEIHLSFYCSLFHQLHFACGVLCRHL